MGATRMCRCMYPGANADDCEFFKALALDNGFQTVCIDYARYDAQSVHVYAVFDEFQSRHTYVRVGNWNGLYQRHIIREQLEIAKKKYLEG